MSKQVLILDDNADNRELLFFALMSRDYDIHQAALGRDAKKIIGQVSVDLALLDVELPDGDGLELAEQIRRHNPEAVLVMLSANDSNELLQQARDLGVNAYVVKPFNLPRLLSFIRSVDEKGVTSGTKMQML